MMTFEANDEVGLLLQAKQIEAKIERGEMGTITHEELKRLMLAKQAEDVKLVFASLPMNTADASAAVERLATLFTDFHLDELEMHLHDPSLALANIDLVCRND